jgi:phosphohistidine phosphatase SixA
MRLTLMRHAKAVAPGTDGLPDAERPLTPAGARRCAQAVRAMRGAVRATLRAEVVCAAPALRTRHTAELAAAAWLLPLMPCPWLALGGDHPSMWPLADLPGAVLVGHEPELSGALALLAGIPLAAIRLDPGTLVVLDGEVHPGGMQVISVVPVKLPRRIRRRRRAGP